MSSKMLLKIFTVIFSCFISATMAEDGPQVTVSQGTLLGKEATSAEGNKYHSYQGIPYAKPPLGELRFKPPQKAEPWSGILDATKEANACRAPHLITRNMTGDEDCLFLNVYVPQKSVSSGKPLPVMFWIHGGGFFMGSGNTDMYGPDYLMDYDVIVVTTNYRLGALGFLSLDLEEAPGNVGMMDQVAALKWVKENIASFGGDPDSVTIFGESAGGASVHLLMLSDLSDGLFHRAIAQSGSALNFWAIQKDPLKYAFLLCEVLGHPTSDPQDALQFLRSQPTDAIVSAKLPPSGQIFADLYFVPIVEKRYPTHEPFLAETPEHKIKSGNYNKIPLMIGYNNAEGILFFLDQLKDEELFNKFEADFERFVPTDLDIPLKSDRSIRLAKKMREYYYKDEPVSDTNKDKFVKLTTDTWFLLGTDKTVRLTAETSNAPVYYYEYGFDEFRTLGALVGEHDVTGACHGDELGFLFKNMLVPVLPDTESVRTTQKRLLTMWTNFAKTGNPTPEITDLLPVKWEPATKEKLNYLAIGDTLSAGSNPRENNLQFWRQATEKEVMSHL